MIPPGSEGKLEVTIKTARLTGEIGKTVQVFSNDPVMPKLTLTIRATVLSSVVVLPREQLRLTDRRASQSMNRVLVRRDPTEKGEMRLGEPETSADWFSAKLTRLTEPTPQERFLPPGEPGDYLLEVQIADKHPYGRVEESVTFDTGFTRQKKVTIPVIGQFQAPVVTSKDKIVFPADAVTPLKEIVLVSVTDKEQVPNLRVEAEPRGLQARLEPSGVRHFKLHVEWSAPRPLNQGAVILTLGDDSFRIPVERGSAR